MRKSISKKPISYSIERAVLSDVLPYETPIIFSNRHFYEFLVNHKIKLKDDSISWIKCKDDDVLKRLLSILFDIKDISSSTNNTLKLNEKELRKIAFHYKITHKEKDFRDLAIPHPKSQIELVSFYEEFKELIVYYSKQSPFSIRKPNSIAKFVYLNDGATKKGNQDDFIEESGKEYKNLKTFFTYELYSNIYKFYEDYIYHRAEKKYNKMFKFDIAKCFDSIYTHSLSWAIISKDFVKNNLNRDSNTFAGKFDKFMQNTNYGETNGIIIGPEFSRIFAELILQQIDKKIEQKLRKKGLVHKVDYEIYRYVDDFFVFYNDGKTKDEVLDNYKINLKEYKMSLNDSKTKLYEKPLITEITIAKNKIVNLLKNKIKFKIKKDKDKEDKKIPEDKKDDANFVPDKKIKVSDVDIRCNSNKLITEFKTIVVESNVLYKDIMNYTLAIYKSSLTRNIKKYEEHKRKLEKRKFNGLLTKKEEKKLIKQEAKFTKYIEEILDFVFFLYGVSPKVNSTIKLVNILSIVNKTFKKRYRFNYEDSKGKIKYNLLNQFDKINQEKIFKKVLDEIILVLDKSKLNENLQIETLYLLIVLKELGKDYRLTTVQLVKYLNLDEIMTSENLSYSPKRYKFKNDINYFVITVLLFYFKDIVIYKGLKVMVKNAIRSKIKNIKKTERSKYSELVLLFFDLVSCPYLKEDDNKFKKEILTLFGIPSSEKDEFIKFVEKQKYWFTKWNNFNLVEELNSKSSLEPYS
ncbi:antiviral reverse transcriptase Drt3b [Hanstruepera ponticola]|uniref:antiviral reverse transcriptase Drt3b n=1 Tax=Hanstruepera ponticola TaxID=2042995 RepID=UPI0017871009|nr:antiviral reverse transcriptase Drt3b [Hanstruepera ponticola]